MKGLRRYQKLELAGLFLLLVSLGWELIVTDQLHRLEQNAAAYLIHEKLENIWSYLDEIDREVPAGLKAGDDYARLHENWLSLEGKSAAVSRQALWASWTKGTLFLLGTALLVFGRFQEMKHEAVA